MTGSQSVDERTPLALVAQWEFGCCGDPLEVGEVVQRGVQLGDIPGDDGWEADLPGSVLLYSGHHGPPVERHWMVAARVSRLWEARQRYVPAHGRRRRVEPGSGEVAGITTLQRWEEDWLPARHGGEPVGWIVQLEVLDVLSSSDGSSLFEALRRAAVQ